MPTETPLRGDDPRDTASTWISGNSVLMSASNDTILDTLAEQYDVDIDTLSREDVEAAELKLQKVSTFRRKGLDERADTLEAEAIELLGADPDTDPSDLDSREYVADVLGDYDLDTLNSRRKVEAKIETLERKQTVFENRGMTGRAEEIGQEIDCLEAAKSEVEKSPKRYENIDTLAKRITRDGEVLTATFGDDGMDLESRETGQTVVLKESDSSDVDTLSRGVEWDTYQPCGVAFLGTLNGV